MDRSSSTLRPVKTWLLIHYKHCQVLGPLQACSVHREKVNRSKEFFHGKCKWQIAKRKAAPSICFQWQLSLSRLLNNWHPFRGVKTAGQEGRNSPGAESLWGCRMTAEDAKKSQQCHKYFLLQQICFRKTSGSKMGCQICFLPLAPSNLVTPLHSLSSVVVFNVFYRDPL